MFRRLGHVALILAVLAASGLHWNLLQTVAWTSMLADNLRANPISEAVQKTFDGRHPCCLCRQIAAGKSSEKKADYSSSLKRMEFVSGKLVFVFSSPQDFSLLANGVDPLREWAQEPPTPPPRGNWI